MAMNGQQFLEWLQGHEKTHFRPKFQTIEEVAASYENKPELRDFFASLSPRERRKRYELILTQAKEPHVVFDPFLKHLARLVQSNCAARDLPVFRELAIGALWTFDVNGWTIRAPNGDPIVVLHNGLMGFAHDSARILATFIKLEPGRLDYLYQVEKHVFADFTIRFLVSCLHFISDGEIPAGPHYISLDRSQNLLSVVFRNAVELFIVGHELGHIALGHLDTVVPVQHTVKLSVYTRSQHQEFEADAWSQEVLHQITQTSTERPNLRGLIFLGGIIFFSALQVLEYAAENFMYLVDRLDLPNNKYKGIERTHPPTSDRLSRLLSMTSQKKKEPEIHLASYVPQLFRTIRKYASILVTG